MSGILNSKERIFDTILTQEGRRQLADGTLRIEYASFTDADVFYEADIVSGSSDASVRIQLEACNLPQDQITFEADDGGKLMPYKGSKLGVLGGKILSGTSEGFLEPIVGTDFGSASETLLKDSINNFQKLHILGSVDLFADDDEFSLSTGSINFSLTNNKPLGEKDIKTISIDDVEGFIQDRRLAHIPNFKFLPPINKVTPDRPNGTKLGDYAHLGQGEILSLGELMTQLNGKEKISVEFSETNEENNIVSQIFELKNNELLKLDVIDYGEFPATDPNSNNKHIYFVGRVFVDGYSSKTFVNLFTLIFE